MLWQSVLRNLFRADVNYGSRTPVSGTPAWITLKVMTGGFATGDFLAGGALQKHESALLDRLSGTIPGEERRALNSHFLSESGLSECFDMLRTGCYEIAVPEEGPYWSSPGLHRMDTPRKREESWRKSHPTSICFASTLARLRVPAVRPARRFIFRPSALPSKVSSASSQICRFFLSANRSPFGDRFTTES